MPTVPPLAITDAERAERQRRVRAHTSPQRAAPWLRARMVLLAADGLPNRQVAPMVGRHQHTVAQWRRRFATERLAGSPTASGRAAPWLRIVATVTQQPRPGQPLEPLPAGRRAGRHGHLGLPDRPHPGRPGDQAPPGAQLDHPAQ
jgi:transposase-like protein